MQKEIRQTWFFNQSPKEVWDYLTRPELLEQWLMKSDFRPIVGHKFTFTCSAMTYCEVLEVKPFSRLVYSWQTNSADGGKSFDSLVVWTLVAKGKGTELQLVHSGFRVLEDYSGHNEGWIACGKRLEELLKQAAHADSNA